MGDLRPAIDEYPEGILSGEWPENFSLLSYADLRAYLESQIVTTDQVSFDLRLRATSISLLEEFLDLMVFFRGRMSR